AGMGGSKHTFSLTHSAVDASAQVMSRLREVAAQSLECAVDDLVDGFGAAAHHRGWDQSVSRRAFISTYAAAISACKATASRARPGRTFTCRIRLPLPSNRCAGSSSSAPMKKPTFTCALKTLT